MIVLLGGKEKTDSLSCLPTGSGSPVASGVTHHRCKVRFFFSPVIFSELQHKVTGREPLLWLGENQLLHAWAGKTQCNTCCE